MSVAWTPEQLSAITSRGHTLLVSAAAGSGKTAVLVERVLRRVTDPSDPQDIDRFLLVTFTKAAADEMRAKLAAALTRALEAEPANRRLRRQLGLLGRAQITTIHAFCSSLLREHFQLCGLSPDFRVADEDEALIMKRRLLDDLIEARYADKSPANAGFPMLADALSAGRDDRRLLDTVLETYEKLQSHPDPAAWSAAQLSLAREACAADPAATPWGREALRTALARCDYARAALADALALILQDERLTRGYADAYYADIAAIDALRDALDGGTWDDAVRAAACVGFSKLGAVRGFEDTALLSRVRAPRDAWKKALGKLRGELLCSGADTVRADLAAVLPAYETLFSLAADFDAAYTDRKRRRNLADFNDLEHLAVRLLCAGRGERGEVFPTDTARALSERYAEILIDEYQDTNEVQDVIFRALSDRERNLFLVGDVKQSIYRFRLADPTIFRDKYERFSDLSADCAPDAPRRVVLSRNFRSRGGVLEAVNYLFSRIMSPALGELSYTEREYLYPGASYPPAEEPSAELCVLDLHTDADDADEPPPERAQAEAAYVARRIRALLDAGAPVTDGGAPRPARPRDIVILLRSASVKAPLYEQALRALSVPVFCETGGSLYEALEVRVVTDLLGVIDNPDQDIPLVSVMRSPLYGFSADELARIRLSDPQASFYGALRAAARAEGPGLPDRCRSLLADLRAYRSRASDMPLERFLWHVYNRTGVLGLYGSMENGRQRQANLLALFEQVRRFEQAGYRGLYAFVGMLARLRESGVPGSAAIPNTGGGDAVRIMSIHKSKGLEFPIVFLPDCAKSFNLDDLRRPVLIHPKLGAGFRRRETERRIEYPTLPRLGIALAARRETLSEELRVLYVAMTRARERLIVTCALSDARRTLSRCMPLSQADRIPAQALLEAGSMAPWLLAPALRLPGAECLRALAGEPAFEVPETSDHGLRVTLETAETLAALENAPAERPADVPEPAPADDALPFSDEELARRLSYRYPHADAARTPSKLTATALKGRFEERESAEQAELLPAFLREAPPAADGAAGAAPAAPARGAGHTRPRFITRAGLTPAERGTALHLAMQFMEPSACQSAEGAARELDRLRRAALLSPAQADAVELRKITAFYASPLGLRMLRAPEVRREFKFSLLVDPAAYESGLSALAPPAPGGDAVVFQGVVDCFFEDADGLVLLDFKTDFLRPGGEEAVATRYRPQLSAYAYALRRILGRPVDETYLYLFSADRAVLLF